MLAATTGIGTGLTAIVWIVSVIYVCIIMPSIGISIVLPIAVFTLSVLIPIAIWWSPVVVVPAPTIVDIASFD